MLAWPVQKPLLFSPGMVPVMPAPGANWHEAVDARDRARADESQRVLGLLCVRAEGTEEREAAEARGEQIRFEGARPLWPRPRWRSIRVSLRSHGTMSAPAKADVRPPNRRSGF